LKKLKKLIIHKIPTATGNIVEPCLEIYDGKNFKLIWTDNPKLKKKHKDPTSKIIIHSIKSYNASKDQGIVVDIEYLTQKAFKEDGLIICGDIFVKICNAKNQELICRFAFNTAFIERGTAKLILGKSNVDPDRIQKSSRYHPDFAVELWLDDACHCCDPKRPLKDLCQNCRQIMASEIEEW